MLKYKKYFKETRTEKAWYDSSMFVYSEMIEDPDENKGDLSITFKNGTTYVYKDVDFVDYVLLIAGGTDQSQGKTLNKLIKPKYNYEKVADRDVEALLNEMEIYQKEDKEMAERKSNTYFISGHRDITEEEFESNYVPVFISVLDENPGAFFIMGDYYGCDIMAQNYLLDVLNVNPERITVYHMLESPRNKNEKITNLVGGFASDEERDEAMTENSSFDIAFVRDIKKNSGTAQNILRRNKLRG